MSVIRALHSVPFGIEHGYCFFASCRNSNSETALC